MNLVNEFSESIHHITFDFDILVLYLLCHTVFSMIMNHEQMMKLHVMVLRRTSTTALQKKTWRKIKFIIEILVNL